MSNALTRMKKRKAIRHMDISELNRRLDAVQDNMVAAAVSMTVNIMARHGMPYEQLCDLANEIVDEYEHIQDFDAYRLEVYERTGIGIIKTPDEM